LAGYLKDAACDLLLYDILRDNAIKPVLRVVAVKGALIRFKELDMLGLMQAGPKALIEGCYSAVFR